MNEEEELLETGRPTLPRPARIAGTVLIVAALVAVFAIRLWPSSDPKGHQAALGSAPPAPTKSLSAPTTAPSARPWPSAASACGGETEVSIVSSQPPAEPTRLRMLLGGSQLRIVDFDAGRAQPLLSAAIPPHTFIATLSANLPGFGTTMRCGGTGPSRILQLNKDGSAAYVGNLRSSESILADGDRAWIATAPMHGLPSIRPLANGPRVNLPANTYPVAIENGVVVGTRGSDGVGEHRLEELLLIDARTGQVEKTRTGAFSQVVGVGAGRVLWTSGCEPTADRPCRLDLLGLDGSEIRHYALPRPVLAGTVNADGTRVALLLESANRRLSSGHPFPPSNIAWLDLRTGRLKVIPGVTVPAKSMPGLAFSPNGHWLGIALDGGTYTRVLAWRPGIGRAYELADLPGPNYGPPPVVSLPVGSD